jgi:SAM-dependent methyltransferase
MLDVNHPNKWEVDYQRGSDGWDLKGATPAFKRLAGAERFNPGKLIVLGAGRGHDARLFARHGFQVTAVDFSAYAVREMQRLAEPGAPVEILQSDLFALPPGFDGAFDYVLEYTCFCAIDPRRRSAYADLVTRLLSPGGIYIDLAYPLDTRTGGPPFAVSLPEVFRLFGERGFTLLQRETPPDTVPQRQGLEELLVFQLSNENRKT